MKMSSSEFESMLAGMPDQGILQISQNPRYMDDPDKAHLVESEKKYRVDTKEGQMAAMAQPPTIAQQNTQRLAGLQMPLDPSTITPDMARGINLAAGGGLVPLAEGGQVIPFQDEGLVEGRNYDIYKDVPISERNFAQNLIGFGGENLGKYFDYMQENPVSGTLTSLGTLAGLHPAGRAIIGTGKGLYSAATNPAARKAALDTIKKGGEKLFTKARYSDKAKQKYDKMDDNELGKLWFKRNQDGSLPKETKELHRIFKDRKFPKDRGRGKNAVSNKNAGQSLKSELNAPKGGARQFSPIRASAVGYGSGKGLEYLMRDAEAQLPKENQYGKLTPFKPVPEGVKGQGQRSGRISLETLTGTTPEGGDTPEKGLPNLLGNPELGQTLLETGLGMLGDTEVRGGGLGSLGRNATKAIKSAEQRKQAKADRKYKADLLGIKEKELELQESLLDIKANQARKALNLSSKDYLSLKQKYTDSAGMQEKAKERALNILIPLTNPGFIDTMFGSQATEEDIDPKLLEGETKRQMDLIFAEDVIMANLPQVSSAMQIAPDLGTGVGLQNPFAGFSSSPEN